MRGNLGLRGFLEGIRVSTLILLSWWFGWGCWIFGVPDCVVGMTLELATLSRPESTAGTEIFCRPGVANIAFIRIDRGPIHRRSLHISSQWASLRMGTQVPQSRQARSARETFNIECHRSCVSLPPRAPKTAQSSYSPRSIPRSILSSMADVPLRSRSQEHKLRTVVILSTQIFLTSE